MTIDVPEATTAVEDIYPLAPLQQGLLFHSLLTPAAGAYIQQLSWVSHGSLNSEALRQSWRQVLDRQAVLRTAFLWEELDEPVQVVLRHVELPYREQDWRGVAPDEQQTRFHDLRTALHRERFLLAEPPLWRFDLLRLTDDVFISLLTYHHLLLDGWGLSVMLREVMACYRAVCRGQRPVLPPPRPYRDHIAWLQQQELAAAESFWREMLGDFSTPTSIPEDHAAPSAPMVSLETAEQEQRLSAETTAALQALAKQERLTLNTLVQGAWALLLSRNCGQDDVVFGFVVSGRPADLPGAESIVGLFANTLPVRVCVRADAWLLPWLHELQLHQVDARQYEYSPLAQVQRMSAIPTDQALFECILAFENYPIDTAQASDANDLVIDDIQAVNRTHYPLAVMVHPGPELVLR
ncbi:MAG TPA: condensation domain-containing protein, partial [Chloroflexota bacterium]|nr:condensation domain-containing protein [Chloroflexota bacterium]